MRRVTTHNMLHCHYLFNKDSAKMQKQRVEEGISRQADISAVCWFGAFKCCVNRMPRRKDISSDLIEAILVAYQSGKATSQKSEIHHSAVRRLFTSGKKSKQFSVFPGVDVPVKSPQADLMFRATTKKKLEWPSQNPDLNLTEMLRYDLNRSMHK